MAQIVSKAFYVSKATIDYCITETNDESGDCKKAEKELNKFDVDFSTTNTNKLVVANTLNFVILHLHSLPIPTYTIEAPPPNS